MIVELHTPQGVIPIDPETVTDDELAQLGITRDGLYQLLGWDADYLRAQELLASSPQVITQPEMWELMRIIGRKLGYHFD